MPATTASSGTSRVTTLPAPTTARSPMVIPQRMVAEVPIEAPYPRDERFRTSAEYAGYCRTVSEALERATGAAA